MATMTPPRSKLAMKPATSPPSQMNPERSLRWFARHRAAVLEDFTQA
ncbi:MAG: hypothetical protein Q8N23_30385 [Archangium sp.]|nr:hypothetical protein [Archangium sp.]